MNLLQRRSNSPTLHFVVTYFEAFQDGTLTDSETKSFQQHLAVCQECRDWVDQQENLIERLQREASPPAFLSPSAIGRIQHNLYNRMRRGMIMNNLKSFVGAAAAVAVLAIIVGFFVLQTRNITTEETVEQVVPDLEAEAQVAPELVAAAATDEQLIEAVAANDAATVKQILEAGVSPDVIDSDGDPILKLAIDRRSTDIVELLVEYGADVNTPDSKGDALLPRATLAGQLEVVQLLLDAGADVHGIMIARTMAGFTGEQPPLVIAADRGYIEIVELLIAYGVDVNQISGSYNGVALHLAAWENHPEIVQILLDNGADPDVYNTWDSGETPLHYAVRNKSHAAVQALVKGGSDVDIQFSRGMTLLMKMIRLRNDLSFVPEIVTIILDAGVDLNQQDDAGDTALHHAVRAERPEIIPILIEHSAVLDIENNNGKTALELADTLNEESAEILREAGASE